MSVANSRALPMSVLLVSSVPILLLLVHTHAEAVAQTTPQIAPPPSALTHTSTLKAATHLTATLHKGGPHNCAKHRTENQHHDPTHCTHPSVYVQAVFDRPCPFSAGSHHTVQSESHAGHSRGSSANGREGGGTDAAAAAAVAALGTF
jgi:hypothetical protein